jgi:CRP-like cAMP-binding protein
VIETGAADVIGDGRLVTTLGPGEGFGEIALLRRVPRTERLTDLELQALTCDPFLPVVTGYPPSSREAEAEVEEMLHRFSPGESIDDQNGPRHEY